MTVVCGVCLPAGSANAGDFAFGGGYFVSYETNPTLANNGGAQADWSQSLFVGSVYREVTSDVDINLFSQIEGRTYRINDQLDYTAGFLDGRAVWRITPQSFSWILEDYLRDSRVDLAQPYSPSNRTQVNSLSTGPDLTLRFSSVNSSMLGARYGRLDDQVNGTTTNYFGYARLIHRISERTGLSLNYEALEADFENEQALYPSTLRVDGFARLEVRSAPNNFFVDIGTTTVTPEGQDSRSGRLFQISASREVSAHSFARLSYAEQFSDTYSDSLRTLTTSLTAPGGSTVTTGMDPLTTDFYYSQRIEALFSDSAGRLGYSFQGAARKVQYATLEDSDYNELGWRAGLSWQFSGLTRMEGTARNTRTEFYNTNQQTVDRAYSLSLTTRLGRQFSLSFEAGQTYYDSTDPDQTVINSSFRILLGYSTDPLYVARSRR